MDLIIELAVVIVVLLIGLAALFALFKFLLKTAGALILNAIGGIVILLSGELFLPDADTV